MNALISVADLYAQARDQPITIPILRDVLHHLTASPGITVKELSSQLNLNRNALSASIKMLTGVPLETFLKHWRLLLIQELLSDPQLSYHDVARRSGYTSVQALSKFLNRQLHLTAYEYREGRKNGHRKL